MTLCDNAQGAIDRFDRVARIEHTTIDDPSWLEADGGGPDVDQYRRVRDKIRAYVERTVKRCEGEESW